MMKQNLSVRVVLAFATSLVGVACGDGQPVRPDTRLTPQSVTLARNALVNTDWVNQVHVAAMRDWMENGKKWGVDKKDRDALCKAVAKLAEAYVPEFEKHSGKLGSDARAQSQRAVKAAPGCHDAASLSLFVMVPSPLLRAASMDGDEVTGAYQAYAGALQAAAGGASSPADLEAAVTNVLASASSLPPGDFNVLASIAGLTIGSASYWYGVEVAGGGGGGSGELPMSLFMAPSKWKVVAASDLAGCIAGAADKLWLSAGGAPGWGIIAGACGVWGVSTSALAWYAT